MSRKTARETAMKIIFEAQFNNDPQDTLTLIGQEDLSTADLAYIDQTTQGVLAATDDLDETIGKYSIGWDLDRLSKVDKAILRLAVYEIGLGQVPGSVAINEAVELAKVYSGDEAAPFINGLLGSYLRDQKPKGE